MLLTCLAFVCTITLVIFKVVLKVAGYIESNLGPYGLLKSLQGSFSQDIIGIFEEIVAPLCACNALFSICWSLVRKISCRTTQDLDHILIRADHLYKSFNKQSFLSVNYLPREIHIF